MNPPREDMRVTFGRVYRAVRAEGHGCLSAGRCGVDVLRGRWCARDVGEMREEGWVRREDVDALREGRDHYRQDCNRQFQAAREARAQAEALAEALDFYSDRDAWLHQWVDGGACARAALRAYRSSQEPRA